MTDDTLVVWKVRCFDYSNCTFSYQYFDKWEEAIILYYTPMIDMTCFRPEPVSVFDLIAG